MESLDLSKYLEMADRRKHWVAIPFLLTLLGGLTYMLATPKIFEAQTLILVQPQKVPTDFVRTIVSVGVEERLKTITQQVTSRTNLESIIKEHKLYMDKDILIDDKVEMLRKRTEIRVARGERGGNSFEIRFRGEDPQKVMQVTNTLASNFISENLKMRESQALGTSMFLTDELESIRKRLAEREEKLKEYRQKYMGAMPDQLQTNLSIISRLQMQLEQLNNSLRDTENRKLLIQKQISDSEIMQKQLGAAGASNSLVEIEPSASETSAGGPPEVSELKKKLAALQTRYTQSHPDVVRLKKTIDKLEADASEDSEGRPGLKPEEAQKGSPDAPGFEMPSMDSLLRPQLEQLDAEARHIKAEIAKVQAKIDEHQSKVDDTPRREQELITLARDYENLKKLYDSMLNRKLEADIAVSMEQKQKGEQFRVLDPAKLPTRPVEPDAKKAILLTIVIGLGLGCGLAYLIELLDNTYKSPGEAEKELGLPVLVSIPLRLTVEELRRRTRRKVIVVSSVLVAFILSACTIFVIFKGIEGSLSYMRQLLGA
jgi:polysaccharide chain length determinant protein (PEP-CTERM system associated)